MLAKLSDTVPEGAFQYEPKWDGFRALVFRDGDSVVVRSRNDRPLERYFPELVEALRRELPPRIVLDGEIVIATDKGLDFEALQLRLHPAKSRVEMLAKQTPSHFVAFDLLALGDEDLRTLAQAQRRERLEAALRDARPPVHITPATRDPAVARDWFTRFEGAGFDGVLAKPLDGAYVEDQRVMVKVKHARTADCVVAGFRFGKDGKGLASLLLGLYDDAGKLHHVGVASGFAAKLRKEIAATLEPLRLTDVKEHPWGEWAAFAASDAPPSRMPGGQSRWTGDKDLSWEAVRPDLVAEVAYDHMQGDRFRHAARFVRWRPDRDARSCSYAQLDTAPPAELRDLFPAIGAS
jgi:ATP-dependent DNA ligase